MLTLRKPGQYEAARKINTGFNLIVILRREKQDMSLKNPPRLTLIV